MAVADILKKIFGSKSERDMKAVKPYLDKVLAVYPEMCGCLYYQHEPAFCAVGSVYAKISAMSVIVSYFDHSHLFSPP